MTLEAPAAWLLAVLMGVAGVLSAGLTVLAERYGRARGLVDLPGARRSHRVVTPRGGGIGIVAGLLAVGTILLGVGILDSAVGAAFLLGLTAVALVGWVDDHGGLSVQARLAVHLAAAGLFAAALWWPNADGPALGVLLVATLLALVAVLNFWNFIDGINGLAASQAALTAFFVMVALGLRLEWGWCLVAAALAVGSCAFLPFNLPRARVFLGDVGSGALGFAVAALLLVAVVRDAITLVTALLLPSAVLLDATLTLALRVIARRRWYSAHRSHLYQWLVRRGRTHPWVTALYAGWTLLVAWPVAIMIESDRLPAWPSGIACLCVGIGAWLYARRRLLRQARFPD